MTMRGNSDFLGRVLARQMARDVELAKKYRTEGQHDRVYDLFTQNLRRALIRAVNTTWKEGEAG